MIKNLSIKNFGPIKTLNVNPDQKNVYIIGPNGTGKSHILRAISLVCTGRHGKSNTNDSLIGPYDKDFEIKLELDDGSVITRTSKTASLTLPDNTKYRKVTDVLEHLPFDPILFYNAAFIKQGKINEIFEKDVGKGVIEKLVSLVLDNKVLADGYKELLAKEREAKAVSSSLQAIIEDVSIEDINTQLSEIKIEINEQKTKLETLDSMVDISADVIMQQKKLWEEHDSLKIRLSEYEDRLKQHKENVIFQPIESVEDLQQQKQQYEIYKQTLKDKEEIQSKITMFEQAQKSINEIKEFFGLDSTLVKANYTDEELQDMSNKKVELYTYLTTEDFTTLDSANSLLEFNKKYGHIDAKSIADEKDKFNRIHETVQQHVEVVKYLKQYSATSDTIETILNKKIETDTTTINDLIKQEESLGVVKAVDENKLIELAEQWNSFKNYVTTEKQINDTLTTLQNKYQELKDQITLDKESILAHEQHIHNRDNIINIINTKTNMQNMLLSDKEKLENNITRKQEVDIELETILYWKQILKDMPGKLRHALLQPVAYHINKDFQELFSFTLGGVTIDWNNMDIVIGDMIIDQLSGAQEVALGLTMHLALLKAMGEQVPIMLIDEPTQFMDTVHINEVKTYLNYLGKQTQMWICTHEDQIVDNVNSIIINTANLS